MPYNREEVEASQEIFYQLLQKRELKEKDNRDLYLKYCQSKDVCALVNSQAKAAECSISRYGDTIYLVPNDENTFLGYSKAELKKILCHAKAKEMDYHLSQFIILTLLVELYDSQGQSSSSAGYIKVGKLFECVVKRLEEGAKLQEAKEAEDPGQTAEVAYREMLNTFQALRSKEGSGERTTKEGFISEILKFLDKQGLIMFIKADDEIKPTTKLTHYMDGNLLNTNNFDRVRKVLGEIPYEQN